MPIQPGGSETKDEFIGRCIGEEIKNGHEQSQAAAICYSKWDTQNMSKMSPFNRIATEFERAVIESDLRNSDINLADYPWDQCIADQTEKYGDEETAKKVCGYIKSKYGNKE